MREPLHDGCTPTPWEVIPSTEHHGPYIVSPYGSTLADLYCMSNPNALSVRNGGDSKPIHFPDADDNASLIVRAVNAYDRLVESNQRLADALSDVIDWTKEGCPDGPEYSIQEAVLALKSWRAVNGDS